MSAVDSVGVFPGWSRQPFGVDVPDAQSSVRHGQRRPALPALDQSHLQRQSCCSDHSFRHCGRYRHPSIHIPPYVHVIMIVGLEVMLFSSAAFMALLFDLKALVDMMSIGTLFAYTLVAICILILRYDITHLYMFELQSTCCCKCGDLINYGLVSRYQEDPVEDTDFQAKPKFNPLKPPPVATTSTSQAVTTMTVISGAWHKPRTRAFMPRFYSYKLTTSFLCAEVASLVGLCVTLAQAIDALARAEAWSIAIVCILGTIVLINAVLIYRQPQNSIKATFMVKQNYILKQLWPQFLRQIRLHHFIPSLQMPLVPFLPLLSIFINAYLMVQLGPDTWIRYAIWMAVGKTVHFWKQSFRELFT